MRDVTIIHILFIAFCSAIAASTALYLSSKGIPLYWLALVAVGAACFGVIIISIWRWIK